MILAVLVQLFLYSVIAFVGVYFVFMMGMPIGIELPDYILERHDPPVPKRVLRFYQGQVAERQAWLRNVLRKPYSDNGYLWLYGSLAPEVFCPQVVRVGTLNGKWMCNPWRIPEGCSIVSLGLGNVISFEKGLQKLTENRCHIFAFDSNNPSNQTIDEFEDMHGMVGQAKIGNTTDRGRLQYTLVDLMEDRSVSGVEVLKVDSASAEVSSFLHFLEEFKVPQLLVEARGRAEKMLRLLTNLNALGYLLVRHEVHPAFHNTCQFTLIHDTAFRKYGVKMLAGYLDFANRT